MAREDDLSFNFLPQLPKDNLDDRSFEDLVAECMLRIPRYCPEWTDHNPSDPGITLIELFSWLTDQMLLRFNKVPRRNYITFLELLGVRLHPPSSANSELTFYVTEPDSFPYTIPAGTEVGTERTANEEAIIFSTDQDLIIGQPNLRYFLTSQTAEDEPRLLRDSAHQWTNNEGEWEGAEQPLFDEQPQPGNCFYFVCTPDQPMVGNVLAITLKGLAATPTGIDPDRPPRRWDAWNGEQWQSVLLQEADDATKGFSFNRLGEAGGSPIQAADVLLHLPQHFPVTVFTGYEGRWLRCVYLPPDEQQPGYVNSPRIIGVSLRAVGGSVVASHSTVIRDELLGISEGIPGQKFQLQTPPILARRPDEYIIVIPPGGVPQTWQEVADFADSSPEDRHYTIDSLTGTVQFGPLIQEPSRGVTTTESRAQFSPLPALGNYPPRRTLYAVGPLERQYGNIPPRGAEIRFRAYRTGGGRQGNVEQGTLNILKTAIPYISRVVNYPPARGGADAESLQQAVLRVPKLLRTRDRAVTQEDFETLTREAGSGKIAKALCLPPNSSGEAGTVSVVVVPSGNTDGIEKGEGIPPERFQLTAELAEPTLAYLNDRKLLGVQVRLREANYVGVAVESQIGLEPAYNNGQAQDLLRFQLEVALYRFLNPLTGGIDGTGWTFGRPVYVSDLVALFQKMPGVRYIGPVFLFELQRQGDNWVRLPDPVQMIDPGSIGLICSWKNRRIRSNHVINFL